MGLYFAIHTLYNLAAQRGVEKDKEDDSKWSGAEKNCNLHIYCMCYHANME